MKKHAKQIKKYLFVPIGFLLLTIVLSSPLWGFLLLMYAAEKGDQGEHREYQLAMEVVKVGEKLEEYKNTHGTYPEN